METQVPTDQVPNWLNEDFFIDIVEKEFNIKKINFDISIKSITPVVGKGENYTSILYRVHLDVKQHDKEDSDVMMVIIKALLELSEDLEKFGVFPKEMAVYSEIIPSFEKIWKDANENVTFSARCLKTTEIPTRVIILDDLRHQGYKMEDRLVGLDMEHCKIFLTKLAKFHAASAVRYENEGPYDSKFDQMYFREETRPFFEMWMNMALKFLIEALEKDEDFKKYIEKIKKIPENLFDVGLKLTHVNPEKLNILNHADAWVNNFLFKHDENGKPIDCLFIDFQGSYYATPYIDLYYFLVSSPIDEIHENGFDELIHHYHTELFKSLTKLNYKKCIPTLKEFHIEMINYSFFGAICLMGILPLAKLNSCEDASMKVMLQTDEAGINFKRKLFSNPIYLKSLKILLKFFDQRGLLDIN